MAMTLDEFMLTVDKSKLPTPEELEAKRQEREETGDRAQVIYDRLKPQIETEENIGKIISIDVLTGDYAIADEILPAADALRTRQPRGKFFAMRIGHKAVYSISGPRMRAKPSVSGA